jgi:Cytochrome P450
MSIAEVLCQISTFIAAGHETTASALTWCLYALARDRNTQDRLRQELRALARVRDRTPIEKDIFQEIRPPSGREQIQAQAHMQEPGSEHEDDEEGEMILLERICGCEYLDWVVREALRVHSPVTNTTRVCMRERDEIPVGKEGYVDRYGRRRWSIPVKRWDIVSVQIQAINKSRALWGEDAGEFRCVSRCYFFSTIPKFRS